jgi:hypothetical protein
MYWFWAEAAEPKASRHATAGSTLLKDMKRPLKIAGGRGECFIEDNTLWGKWYNQSTTKQNPVEMLKLSGPGFV